MSTAGSVAPDQAVWQPKVNPWIIVVAVSLAAFMEDTSIASVALPHIAGSMGASNDESTWVLTSYLVSNAVVLPLSGFRLAGLDASISFLPASRSLQLARFCAASRRASECCSFSECCKALSVAGFSR